MGTPQITIRRLAVLGLPMAAEQVLIFGITLVDTAVAGQVGAQALSAQVVVGQWVAFTSVVYSITVIGGSVLVAQRIGQRDARAASHALGGTLALALVSGLVVAAVALLFGHSLLEATGIPPSIVALCLPYFRIVALSFPISFLLLSAGGCIRGAGDARTPFLVMVTANIVHVVAALVLVFGVGPLEGMGLAGIGLATLLSRGLGLALILGLLLKGTAGLKLIWPRSWFAEMKRVWGIGSAVGGEQVALRFGQLINVRIVAGLGAGALAAYGVVLNSLSLILMLGVGFMTATLTIVGQQIGAGEGQNVQRTGWLAMRFAWVIMGGLALAFYLWPGVTRFFSADDHVLALAQSGLVIVLLGVPFEVINQILTGVLRGVGDTATPMWLTILGHWIIRLPLILFFIHIAQVGLNAVWIAMVIEMAVRSIFYVQRFRSRFWLNEAQMLAPEAKPL